MHCFEDGGALDFIPGLGFSKSSLFFLKLLGSASDGLIMGTIGDGGVLVNPIFFMIIESGTLGALVPPDCGVSAELPDH